MVRARTTTAAATAATEIQKTGARRTRCMMVVLVLRVGNPGGSPFHPPIRAPSEIGSPPACRRSTSEAGETVPRRAVSFRFTGPPDCPERWVKKVRRTDDERAQLLITTRRRGQRAVRTTRSLKEQHGDRVATATVDLTGSCRIPRQRARPAHRSCRSRRATVRRRARRPRSPPTEGPHRQAC